MEDNLVGYLCNALDEEEQQAVEDYLQQNPDAQRRLDVLRRALEPLAADQEPPAPPAGLVVRTLARVAEHSCHKMTPAPVVAGKIAPQGRWWRRADVLVAAALLVAILGIGLSGLHTFRQRSAIADCESNLIQFHQSLVDYSSRHDGCFPSVRDHKPYDVAGIVVPVLMEDQGEAMPSIRCPGHGTPQRPTHKLADLRQMDPEEFARHAPHLSGCYAYTLGYRDDEGRYHGLSVNSDSNLPLMGDRPDRPDGNSLNHGGKGQNVLHVNGKVRFYRQRTTPTGDDIYLNNQRRVAAGEHAGDAVLGSSGDRP